MQQGDYKAAKDWFQKEARRAPSNHEVQFWLAIAHFLLGEVEQARTHLAQARENSTTRRDHALYSAKLEWLKSYQTH
jgi:thioredoxin-like negative regulator of GroEL